MGQNTEQKPQEYSPVPRKRRGNRRATGGSSVGGQEPRLAGLEPLASTQFSAVDNERDAWMKAQKPPHYGS